jgi:four helix bundle protein
MDHDVLKKRTALFSRQVSKFTRPLFRSPETADVARQLRRAANGIASNYRAAGLSRSHKEFVSRIATVLEESDESAYWFEHLRDAELAWDRGLLLEAIELRNIFKASFATACRNETEGARENDFRARRRRKLR